MEFRSNTFDLTESPDDVAFKVYIGRNPFKILYIQVRFWLRFKIWLR